jgi:hypothetical protein
MEDDGFHWPGAGDRGRAGDDRRLLGEISHDQDLRNQADEGIAERPRKHGIVERLRSVFTRDDSAPGLFEGNASSENAWDRERRHRAEHQHDELDSRG